MLVAIKFIIIVLSVASCITIKFKFKQENSILITFLFIGILLYLLGLFNLMKLGIYLILILMIVAWGYILYSIYNKKIEVKEIFTVGTVLYIFALIIVSILLRNTYYKHWDEFSHWALVVKNMYGLGNLGLGPDSTVMVKNYLSGTANLKQPLCYCLSNHLIQFLAKQ